MNSNQVILKEVLLRYLDTTKVMYSAIQSGNVDVFQKLVQDRGEILQEFNKLIDIEESKSLDLTIIIEEIKSYEEKISVESENIKKDLKNKMSEKKKKHTDIKKANAVSNKYKFGGYEGTKSSYIDRKK